jgi:hypothetical protein
MGAQTYNNVGSEIYPTVNRLLKGVGNEHVGDSIVSETGGGIGISGSLSVTGSIIATGSNTFNGTTTLSGSLVTTSTGVFAGRVTAGGNMLLGEIQSSYSLLETTSGNGIWLRPAGASSPTGLFGVMVSCGVTAVVDTVAQLYANPSPSGYTFGINLG